MISHLVKIFLVLYLCTTLAIGAQCPIQSVAKVDLTKYINRILVSSPFPFYVSQASEFQVAFYGTTGGTVSSIVNGNEATITLSVSKNLISASNSFHSPLFGIVIFGLVGGAISLRLTTKGPTVILVMALAFTSASLVDTAIQTSCETTTANIQIPFGQVNQVCDSNGQNCTCGPGYYGTNCEQKGCDPTPEQLARRFNYTEPYPPIEMELPAPGEYYCDSNFGTQVWRISNRVPLPDSLLPYYGKPEIMTDNRIALLGQIGFSPGNKYFLAQPGGALNIIYEINIDENNVPNINTKNRTFIAPIYKEDGGQAPMDPGNAFWMTETRLVYIYGYSVYSVDVSQNPPDGRWSAMTIGTLESYITNSYYTDIVAMHRCSSSRRRPDGSVIMHCGISTAVGNLKAPDHTQIDSHPGATCVNAATFQGAAAQVGHITFKIKSATPADPSTNVEVIYKFLNGVDSDDWYCYQSVIQHSDTNGTRRWVMYNGFNNGYKSVVDRSGEWINQAGVIDQVDTLKASKGSQPMIKFKLVEGQGLVRSVVNDYEGHGGIGWASELVIVDGPAPCYLCLAYWDYETIPDEDPGDALPLFVGYKWDDGPWAYEHGLYGNYFHATANNRQEGIVQTGCNPKDWDCDIIPCANEVIRALPDQNGGVFERLVSTRGTSNTLYNVITSECDDIGPCWAAFQSTWGVQRPDPDTAVDSDIFIFRFR